MCVLEVEVREDPLLGVFQGCSLLIFSLKEGLDRKLLKEILPGLEKHAIALR